MKFFKLYNCLTVISIIVAMVFALAPISFANDYHRLPKGLSVETLENSGKFGLGRVSAENLGSKTTANLFKSKKKIIAEINPVAIVYAAYTSYTDEYENDTCWAWVYPHDAYLFVTFRVTSKTKVKVNWEIEGTDGGDEYSQVIEDPEETDGLLNPDYWYFAWWNPEDSLEEGLYNYLAVVKPYPQGKKGKDSCQFEVIGD